MLAVKTEYPSGEGKRYHNRADESVQSFARLRRRNGQPTVTQEKQLKRVDGLTGTRKVTQYGEIPEEDLQQRGDIAERLDINRRKLPQEPVF